MYASNYFEENILKLMRGTSNTIAAPSLYLGLFLSSPSDTGSAGTECSYTGYARKRITFSAPTATDDTSNDMSVENASEITFPECQSGSETVTYIGIFNASSAGQMLLYGNLTSSLLIQQGVSPVFRAGSIKYTMSGNITSFYKRSILNTLRGTSLTGFTPYIALCDGDPTNGGSEFSGNNYGRIAVTMTAPSQQTSGVAQSKNSAQVISAVSSGSWGNLTHVAIYNASSGGNAFAVVDLRAAYNVTYNIGANASVGFRSGEIVVSVN